MERPLEHPLGSEPLRLIDTRYSGNAWKIRLACGYMGLDVVRQSLDILKGDLQTDDFAALNPFRQVPVLLTREGTWLAESQAILWYLGMGTDWLPESRIGQAQVSSWLSFEQSMHMHAFAQPRLAVSLRRTASTDDPSVMRWREQGGRALSLMEAHLSKRAFFVGERPTIADVALYPYTAMADEGGYDLSGFGGVNDWLVRMAALPGFVALLESKAGSPAEITENRHV